MISAKENAHNLLQSPTQCIDDILNAIKEYQVNPQQAVTDLINGIECILNTLNMTPASLIQEMLRRNLVSTEEVLDMIIKWDVDKVREVVKAWLHL